MPFVSKYFVNEYFGGSDVPQLPSECFNDSGQLDVRSSTDVVKNMTQATRVRHKNMTQATRVFSKNMTQPTRVLFRFTLHIHRFAP